MKKLKNWIFWWFGGVTRAEYEKQVKIAEYYRGKYYTLKYLGWDI
jgi:hypothetical protein